MVSRALQIGMRVRVVRPMSPTAFRRGQMGVVDATSEYQPPRKKETDPMPPKRLLVWVLFVHDGKGGNVPTRGPFWDSELEVLDGQSG
jgi:hypothetical protein